MDDWVLWLIAAAILGIGETLTLGFFLAPFAAGALVAALVSALGAGLGISLVVALVVSLVVLAALRPIARAHRRQLPSTRTGTAALGGREVRVLDRVSQDTGLVKLEGEHWTARSYADDRVYEPGERVTVVEIKGATALVTE